MLMLMPWRKLHLNPAAPRRAHGLVLVVALGVSAVLFVGLLAGGLAAPAAAATVTVRPGQNLTEIAAELHTTVAALAAANGITDLNRVLAGQRLVVPGTEATAPGGAGQVIVVQRGQTLTAIARRYGVSVAALAAANGIADPNRILAGSRLVIPSAVPGSGMDLTDYSVPLPGKAGLPAALLDHPDRLALVPGFASAATAFGVPRALLEALCWWESGWQETVVSVTGAIGVCQIEPATVTFVNRYLVSAPLDPRVTSQNIALGAVFLGSLLRATGGSVGQALAGYYQGLASVRQQGMMPATTTYVRGVEAYAAIFAAAG
jgi:N-acetylmuramoyl-L-alanine amidase